jgi:flagellar basal-body rod modification protein FlgD
MQVSQTQAYSAAADITTTQSAKSTTSDMANKDVFLQLMVAQLKNQDPLSPADSAQFMGQLAQFSQLEQLVGIRQELTNLNQMAASAADTTIEGN